MMLRQSSNNLYRSLLPLAVGTFVLGTDGFVLSGLLPLIAADLHVSVPTAGQLTTMFAWTYAIASPLIAAATGSWDRRWLLGGGAVLFVIGMIGQAAGESFAVMAAARVVAAIGAAAFQANAFAVAGVIADDAHRGRALSIVTAGITLSSVAGVPIGIFAERWIGWRGVLWGIALGGALAALLVLLLPRVTLSSTGLRDRIGVLTRPPVLRVLLVTTLQITAVYTTIVYLPVVVAASVPQSMLAWLLLAMGIGQVIGNARAGRAVDRYGPQRTLTVGLVGALLGLALLGVAIHTAWAVFVALAVTGLFGSAILVPQQHRLFGIAPDAPTVALGLNGSAIYLGAGIGSIVGATVLDSSGSAWLPWTSTLIACLALALALQKAQSPSKTPAPTPA
ncbi:MFS transporter [Nocardia abscessus]|uniref:MFS transporter n=1 Tax=Nocardia abscessus TaxID=120957 RepID=UPI001894028E|nr:MFS transporter [Nocardia abscessus]MBF6334487.1 MFS transporter [Nocardia abscessus]